MQFSKCLSWLAAGALLTIGAAASPIDETALESRAAEKATKFWLQVETQKEGKLGDGYYLYLLEEGSSGTYRFFPALSKAAPPSYTIGNGRLQTKFGKVVHSTSYTPFGEFLELVKGKGGNDYFKFDPETNRLGFKPAPGAPSEDDFRLCHAGKNELYVSLGDVGSRKCEKIYIKRGFLH